MLTYDQLKNYYPKELIKNNPKNVLVEYLQFELLDSIFKQKGSQLLTFWDFEKLTELVKKDMELKGFSLEFKLVEKTAFHCYLKLPDLLYNYQLSQISTEKILVRLDTLPKKITIKPNIYTLNKFGIYRNILVNSSDILLAQKLLTIFSRQREKGRDFYDISFLYSLTEPNFDYIEQTLKMEKADFIQKFLEICGQINFNQLAREIEPFISNPDQADRVKNFKSFISQKLSKELL